MEKNIALAIQKENEYLQEKLFEEDNTASIYDYLKEAGYDNTSEYYHDKNIYLLRTQNYSIVREPEINANIPKPYLRDKIPAFLYTIECQENYAFITNDFDNLSVLERYGYTPVRLGYNVSRGPILSSSGDLRIYLIIPGEIEVDIDYFTSLSTSYLGDYFDNVTSDKNDILISGRKVCGGVQMSYGGMKIFIFQFTFIDKTQEIEEICGVSEKRPGYIDSSVLSPEQLKDEFISWLQ